MNNPKLSLPLLVLVMVGLVGWDLTLGMAAPRDKEKWNKKYETKTYVFGKEPISFLSNNIQLLPKGRALDLAMGEGRNGVYLAKNGFDVTGIDISEEGLKKANALALEQGVRIATQARDLETIQLPSHSYDVILCAYYLQRDLFPQIIAALKPGGMAMVETYTIDHAKYRPRFPKNYLLKTNELLDLFKGLKVIRYQAVDTGQEAYASILVQKPMR